MKTNYALALAIAALAPDAMVTAGDDMRWASSGGGWRSMVADMAYANLLQRAGIFTDKDSSFSAISTNSGGSWFSTQFFFSDDFYDIVTKDDPEDLKNFVTQWMISYYDYQKEFPKNDECKIPGSDVIPALNTLEAYCNIFADDDGSWAEFVEGMLAQASTEAYDDPDFSTKTTRSDQRVNPLRNTDLLIQSSLAPLSRNREDDMFVYISPSSDCSVDGDVCVYAVPIALQYVVNGTGQSYVYGVGSEKLEARAETNAPLNFSMDDYQEYYLYPGTNGEVFTGVNPQRVPDGPTKFQEPFGGLPTTSQIAAASSATIGDLSGLVPSVLAQFMSEIEYSLSVNASIPEKLLIKDGVNEIASFIYDMQVLDNIAVASQWPEKNGKSDGRLIDGSYSDGTTLALNIGQYHSKSNVDLSETLKVIVTSNNYYTDTDVNVLNYFSTDYNAEVAPGDFLWAPSTSPGGVAAQTPYRSYQIFDTYLDQAQLDSMMDPIPGTNLTTTVLEAVTTDNEAFGVKAGQKVEILLLKTNSNVPTVIVGQDVTSQYVQPLADLALDIASSSTLLERVTNFWQGSA